MSDKPKFLEYDLKVSALIGVVHVLKVKSKYYSHSDTVEGICSLFNSISSTHRYTSYLERFIRKWPKFSGNSLYPVPCPELEESEAFLYACWDNDRYGDNRRELCKYLADKIQEDINLYLYGPVSTTYPSRTYGQIFYLPVQTCTIVTTEIKLLMTVKPKITLLFQTYYSPLIDKHYHIFLQGIHIEMHQ